MESNLAIVLVLVVVIIAIIWSIAAPKADEEHIREDLSKQGHQLLEVKSITSPGWGEDDNRYYSVLYLQPDGEKVTRICQTTLQTGVFWTSDKKVVTNKDIQDGNYHQSLLKNISTLPDLCYSCNKPVHPDWNMCKHCGSDIIR